MTTSFTTIDHVGNKINMQHSLKRMAFHIDSLSYLKEKISKREGQ